MVERHLRALAGIALGRGFQPHQVSPRGLPNRGIADFRVFTDVHPEFVRQCMSEIRVIDVNHER